MKRRVIVFCLVAVMALGFSGCVKEEHSMVGTGYTPREVTVYDSNGEELYSFTNFDSAELHWRRLALRKNSVGIPNTDGISYGI